METERTESLPSAALESTTSVSDHAKIAELEALSEELRRKNALIEKKELDLSDRARALEQAEQRIRALVRSEGEAEYKSRTLAAKLLATEKNLEELNNQKRAMERAVAKAQQDSEKMRFELQSVQQQLQSVQEVQQNRVQSSDQLEHKNRDLESKLSRASSKLELYRGKLESLQRQLADKDTENQLTAQKLELLIKEQERLRGELDNNRASSRAQRASQTDLEESLYVAQRRISELEESLERRRGQDDRQAQERESIDQQVETLRSSLAAEESSRRELLQQVEDLQEQISALEQNHAEEIGALQSELDHSRRIQSDLEAAQQDLEEETLHGSEQQNKLQQALHAADGERAELRQDRERLEADLLSKKRQIAELTRWAERVRPAYETLKTKFSELQQEYRQAVEVQVGHREEAQRLKALVETLQTGESAKAREVERLTALVAQLEASQEAVRGELMGRTGAVEGLQQRVEQLESETEALRDELSQAVEASEMLDGEVSELSRLLDESEQSKRDAETRVLSLESDLEDSRRQKEIVDAQLAESEKISARLNHELAQQQTQTSKAQSNLKELLRQRSQLMDAKKLLEDALADSQGKEKKLQSDLRQAEQQRDVAGRSVEEMQLELEGVNRNWIDRIQELDSQLKGVNAELEEVKAKLEETDTRLHESDRALDAERNALARLQTESRTTQESLELQVSELRQALDVSNQVSTELNRQLDQMELERRQNLDDIEALQDELREESELRQSTETSLAASQSAHDRLEDKLRQVEDSYEALQGELVQTKQTLQKNSEERAALRQTLEESTQQNRALKEALARSQKEALSLREYIDKLQTLSKERLEQARQAIEKRDIQLKKHLAAYQEVREENNRLERKLERTLMAESALRGALTDLRHQIMEKAEMVEELEWHLGLVYQNLEDGQMDIEGKEVELSQLNEALMAVQDELRVSEERNDEYESQVSALKTGKGALERELADKSEAYTEASALLAKAESRLEELSKLSEGQKEELERSQFALQRTSARLERVLADLTEEQERSARLGAQLTDALQDRNKRVARLRELQREFSEWRSDSPAPEVDDKARQLEELTLELEESHNREVELQKTLAQLRETLAEAKKERQEEASTPAESMTAGGGTEGTGTGWQELHYQIHTGVELGSQVLSAQMDVLELGSRHEQLTELMGQVETKEALSGLLEELRACDDDKEMKSELLDALQTEWEQFRSDLIPEAREILDSLISLVEAEMKQARAAEQRLVVLQKQLQSAGPVSTDDGSESRLQELEAQLAERTILAEELEEELASVSAQLTEANDSLARLESDMSGAEHGPTKENLSLRDELREKTELLERYRRELHQTRDSNENSLEERIRILDGKYRQGRNRVVELLQELDDRDRMLRQLCAELVPGESEEGSFPDTLTLGETAPRAIAFDGSEPSFDLPLPTIPAPSEAHLAAQEFEYREETLEDFPAIPYPTIEPNDPSV